MKRFVMAAIISATMFAAAAALLASCTWMPVLEEEGDASLTFRFLQTKAGSVPDTGSFILRVCPVGADKKRWGASAVSAEGIAHCQDFGSKNAVE